MRLIADAGSTKIRWALIDTTTGRVLVEETEGVNPVVMSNSDIEQQWRSELGSWLSDKQVSEVWYYGAGCVPAVCADVGHTLSAVIGCAECHVASDMLGAVRAFCGNEQGVVCILGTGSNSCLCDAGEIVDNIPPLGFILGDEGSGAALGRRLVNAMLKREFPINECGDFLEWLGLTPADIVARVYRSEKPNQFLASLTRYIALHIDTPLMAQLVEHEFEAFIRNNVMRYDGVNNLPVYFTGSVAQVFSAQLESVMSDFGLTLAGIDADPLPGLVNYHS